MSDQKNEEQEMNNQPAERSDAYKYILVFLGGLAAGVALGLYLNSKQGKELRKQFTNRMSKMEQEIESKVSAAMEEINRLAEKGGMGKNKSQEG